MVRLRRMRSGVLLAGAIAALAFTAPIHADTPGPGDSRIAIGLRISPVPMHLHGRNHALVGLGSYIVNAQAGCNECHTCPSYRPDDNPYLGAQPGRVNAANYLAGGVPFGPFISANLTPDPANGLPEGHTFAEFVSIMRTGHDPDEPGRVLQVMPWPVYRHMTDRDLRAIYEYLASIPHAEPGTCTGPGQ